jgi:hypothetical protein
MAEKRLESRDAELTLSVRIHYIAGVEQPSQRVDPSMDPPECPERSDTEERPQHAPRTRAPPAHYGLHERRAQGLRPAPNVPRHLFRGTVTPPDLHHGRS